MPNYKEEQIINSKYQRACKIVIDNQLDKIPQVTFIEEEITILSDGSKTHKLVDTIKLDFDPNEMVTMIDMETNLPTETVYPTSLAQWIIYSLYWKKATDRDNQ